MFDSTNNNFDFDGEAIIDQAEGDTWFGYIQAGNSPWLH
jgi:hypothetical protein